MKCLKVKRFSFGQVVGLLTIVFWGIAVIAYAVNIPNTFTSGNPIRSSEVNANFNAVKNAIDALEAGPNVIALEDRPGVISVPTLWANSTSVCTSADYTPPRNQRALINADMSFASSAQQTFNIWPAYSNDSGASDANIQFDELCNLLENMGFEKRIRGSHHIFRKEGIIEKINLQREGNKAKPYQVRQVRNIIVKYKFGGDINV